METWGPEGPVIGIDLGTTFSCVAVMKNGKVEIIQNDQGNRVTPSIVDFTAELQRLVGEAAKNQANTNPENTIFDAKRLIGRGWSDPFVQNDIRTWPFKVISVDGKPVIVVHEDTTEKHLTAEEISAAVLSKMKQTAETFLGCPVSRAVVTVPAYFNDSQRQATKLAGTIAGLNILRIINEPTAAALAYSLDLRDSNVRGPRKVLIFDLGGGTFDVSILEIHNGNVDVITTGGDPHLGGEDFDNRLVTYFAADIKRKKGIDITQNAKALRRLRTECEIAKRSLTNNAVQAIDIACLHDNTDYHTRLTRAKFEDLNKDYFTKCMEIVDKCIKDAKMEKSHIDDVVLVGGSTRIVKVQELLVEFFGEETLRRNLSADEAVAMGAAIQAYNIGLGRSGASGGIFNRPVNLRDVTSLSLGTPDCSGVMKVFIPRNTPIPATEEQRWTITQDNMTSTTFPIYEGERQMAKDNNKLGEVRLHSITAAPAFKANIKVIFHVSDDGILSVSAEDMISGNKAMTTISGGARDRHSQEEVDRMIREAEHYRLEDERFRRRAEAKNELESYACITLAVISKHAVASRLPGREGDALKKAFQRVLDWLEEDKDCNSDMYGTKKEELKNIWEPVRKRLGL